MKWLRNIIDAIRWARAMMLAEREDNAFTSKVARFVTYEVWPASLRYKEEHGHMPKYLLLPMDKLSDVHRIIETRQLKITEDMNRCCNMELKWNGEEGDGDWSVGDKDPCIGE